MPFWPKERATVICTAVPHPIANDTITYNHKTAKPPPPKASLLILAKKAVSVKPIKLLDKDANITGQAIDHDSDFMESNKFFKI